MKLIDRYIDIFRFIKDYISSSEDPITLFKVRGSKGYVLLVKRSCLENLQLDLDICGCKDCAFEDTCTDCSIQYRHCHDYVFYKSDNYGSILNIGRKIKLRGSSVTYNDAVNKVCNSDLCSYYESCKGLNPVNFCIIDVLFNEDKTYNF